MFLPGRPCPPERSSTVTPSLISLPNRIFSLVVSGILLAGSLSAFSTTSVQAKSKAKDDVKAEKAEKSERKNKAKTAESKQTQERKDSPESGSQISQASVTAIPTGDFTAAEEDKSHDSEKKEIEALLANLENLWNQHDIEGVMDYYAEDYINNDGIDKSTVRKLTTEFWGTYPDAHSTSRTKNVRVEGAYATVDSRDSATGTTAKEFNTIKSKGELQSLSEGQLYLKNLSGKWKIIGDRIDFEKVKVCFGLARQLSAAFTAPEQMKSGKAYSAKLEVNLPPGLNAVGSITNQPLKYPQVAAQDNPRVMEGPTLERVMNANTENCNELLTARILLTDPTRNKVLGVTVFTRRLNVVPEQKQEVIIGEAKHDKDKEKEIAKEQDKEQDKDAK